MIVEELIAIVREQVGPVASFKQVGVVSRLPKTRSGKVLRGTMRKIADGEPYQVPPTIDDPATLDEVRVGAGAAGVCEAAGGSDRELNGQGGSNEEQHDSRLRAVHRSPSSSPAPRTGDRDQPSADRTAAGATAAEKPAPFDKGPVKIALVQYSGAGDYFQQWTKGARQQADAVGFTMQHYDAQADDAKQAADMKTAIGSGVAGIIVDHGRSPTMCPLINQATDAGIAVVVYDVKVADCAPKAVETAQNDADLATLVLTQMAKDIGDGVPVGYVNPFVIAPLERRDVVWKKFVADHKWDQKFIVGKFSHDVATDNAKLAAAALKKHPEVKAVFAPYDELTKGTVSAIEQNKLGSKVAAYGIDISNADIELMTKKDSPGRRPPPPIRARSAPPSPARSPSSWPASSAATGRVPRRPGYPVLPVKEQIKNMDDLRAKLPDLNLADVASAPGSSRSRSDRDRYLSGGTRGHAPGSWESRASRCRTSRTPGCNSGSASFQSSTNRP